MSNIKTYYVYLNEDFLIFIHPDNRMKTGKVLVGELTGEKTDKECTGDTISPGDVVFLANGTKIKVKTSKLYAKD